MTAPDLPTPQNLAKLAASLAEEHVALTIDGRPYEVLTLAGYEKLSTLFRFDMLCADVATAPGPRALLGRSCEIVLHDGFGVRRSIQGMLTEAERFVRDQGTVELRVTVRPNQHPLTLSRSSRVFNDLTVPAIVDRVLEKLPTKHPYRWELTKTYRTRVYTAQYREEDWTFIARLLEDEGIYYWFDHEGGDSVLVFSDDSTAAPDLTGGAPLEFAIETGMLGRREYIHELASEAHATATRFTVTSFDPWNPALKVTATEGSGFHEIYEAPGGGPESPEVCRAQAKKRLEIALSHRAGVSGNASSVRLDPGRVVAVVGHPLHEGRHLVTEVVYEARQRRAFSGEGGGYRCHFEAIREAVAFRPPEATPVSQQAGIQTGRVVGPPGEEIHTDERGRVRVQLHWDREGAWDDKAGKWMRIAQRGVAMSMAYPRTGWNVTALMEEGNVDAPSVMSRLHDAAHPPTYPLPANKTRTVFRTATSPGGASANEIRFEDLLGIQEFFVNASRDMNYQAKNDFGLGVAHDQTRSVGGNQDVSIGATMLDDVKNDQDVTVGGDEELEIAQDRTKSVGGDETETIAGRRSLEVGSNVAHTVGKKRTLEVSGDATEKAKEGLIKVSASTAKVTIKGPTLQELDGVLSEIVTTDAEKTVGAGKSERCKDAYSIEVNGEVTETIEGSLFMRSDEHFMDGADKVSSWTVDAAIVGKTPSMHVQAKERILLKVGSSVVEIEPSGIAIRASAYELDDADSLVVKTLRIEHNV
ncbi:MAG: type VI secretion system tip protein VgrG [Deltaproteobacteria bacterium]|nr:type VI secretion system tip protein VgrG [Deltaproteobacteria bacterium]